MYPNEQISCGSCDGLAVTFLPGMVVMIVIMALMALVGAIVAVDLWLVTEVVYCFSEHVNTIQIQTRILL